MTQRLGESGRFEIGSYDKPAKILLSMTVTIAAFAFIFVLFSYSDALCDTALEAREEQIKAIESKLSQEKNKFDMFNSEEKDLLARLTGLEKEVSEQRHAVDKLKKNIRLAKTEVKTLEKTITDLKGLLKDAEMLMTRRLVALYKYTRISHFRVLADARGLDQFWQRIKYVKTIMEEDRKVLTRLADQALKYKMERLRAQERIDNTLSMIDKEKVRLSSLRKNLEKKVVLLMKVHKEKEFYETSVKELKLAAKRLKETLITIEKKETYKVPRSSIFADSKGQLLLPLKGKVKRSGKLLKSAGPSFHKGVLIEGSSDAEVRAVFPGRVDFSGSLKGYGEIIVINHGSRFFTISAKLSHREKEEGDVVKQGEVIGLAGRNRISKGAGFYFEIRRGGKNLDPIKWLKIN